MVGLSPDDRAPRGNNTDDDDSFSPSPLLLVVILFIIFGVAMTFQIYKTRRERTENTTACLQELGYTAAQCEFILSTRGPVEDCMRLFSYSQEQCEFIVIPGEGVEDCMRLFEHTQEQCTLLTRIKPKPIPTL